MTQRERFLETLLFGKPDRIPLQPGGARESTRENWHQQGLPGNVEDYNAYAYRQAGGKLELPTGGPGFPVRHTMMPEFDEKVLEEHEESRTVQDWKGNVCEIGKEFSVEYLRNAKDFCTRRWIKCPVENREDWASMQTRYDAEDPSRLPEDAEERAETLRERTWPIQINVHGPFWQLREWLGFENLCIYFYDQPALVDDMLTFWKNYIARLLERASEYVIPDCIRIQEDMAYKNYSMISPAMVREKLLPVWCEWGDVVRKMDVPVYAVDSDGYVGELIPIWIEAGINACDPLEVAAGNDIVAYRERFGQKMAFRGGIDKRAMAAGGGVLEQELQRLKPVIDGGGYIPSCDHAVPPDVSWPNYVQYVKRLAQLTGWL